MTAAEHESELKHTTDTPNIALTGKLWGAYCENFGENRLHYNGIALYITGPLYGEVASEAASPHKSVEMLSTGIFIEMYQNNQSTNQVLKLKYFIQSCNS